MKNFVLLKLGKLAVYIGPYKLAFNDPEDMVILEEEDE